MYVDLPSLTGALRASIKSGKATPRFWAWSLGFLDLYAVMTSTVAAAHRLDDKLFPGWRRTEVKEPVFIFAGARSGTTLLHRLLTLDESRALLLELGATFCQVTSLVAAPFLFLSESLEVEICRDGKVYRQSYERGDPRSALENTGVTDRRGTKITFKPDSQIFETTTLSFETLSQRLRELSFLNKGILITLADERDGRSHRFQYEGGISSFVERRAPDFPPMRYD